MPTLKPDAALEAGQLENPIIEFMHVAEIDSIFGVPTYEQLREATGYNDGKKTQRLKTWGRTPKVLVDDPHWIGVRNGTAYHVDTGYPRYTYQLKILVDEPTHVRGWDGVRFPLSRGLFYTLDTHSPHQVVAPKGGEYWNVSLSWDSHELVDREAVLKELIAYAKRTDIYGNPTPS